MLGAEFVGMKNSTDALRGLCNYYRLASNDVYVPFS